MKTRLFVSVVPFLMVLWMVGCGGGGDQAKAVEDAVALAEGDASGEEAPVKSEEMSEQDLLNKPDPEGVYGAGVQLESPVTIAAILEDPESYKGSAVRVEGTVTQVCPMRGCWIDVTAADETKIRVKVNDGVIVFPLSAKGKHAVVEGTVEKIELTEEQAKGWMEHEAAETGEAFDPASVTGPMTIWRIRGSGAEIEG